MAGPTSFICYCNNGKSAEFGADGGVFRLPGGVAKVAVGMGYRYNLLDAFRGEGNNQNIDQAQDSYYAYGEISLPLVSSEQQLGLIHSLSLSGAVRYERYPGIDNVATPKVGLIYAPSPDFEFKASWGKSFRAPTLLQQYQARQAVLYDAADVGGVGYRIDLGARDSLSLMTDASYLESEQQLSAGQPTLPLAGLIFNPPHWHARGGVTWTSGPLTLNGTASYVGGVDDTRFMPTSRVGSMTTLDTTIRLRPDGMPAPFRDMEFDLSVLNLFNDKPSAIASTYYQDAPFDSTNYSPVGRFLSVGFVKKW